MIDSILEVALHNVAFAAGLSVVALVAAWTRNAPLVHAVWLIVLLRLVVPPLIPLSVDVPNGAPEPRQWIVSAVDSSNVNGHETNADPTGRPSSFNWNSSTATGGWENVGQWLFGGWLLGIAAVLLMMIWRIVRLRRFVLRATSPASTELHQEVATIAKVAGVSRAIHVRVTSLKLSPSILCGWRRFVLVLPTPLWNELSTDERSTLIAHELAHVRRRDALRGLFASVVTALYWWNPVAWLARSQLRVTAEQCCDGLVLRWLPDQAVPYSRCMLKTLDFLADTELRSPVAGIGFGEFRFLKKRLTMILNCRSQYRMSTQMRFVTGAFAAMVLLFAPVIVATNEQQADKPSQETSSSGPVDVSNAEDMLILRGKREDVDKLIKTLKTASPEAKLPAPLDGASVDLGFLDEHFSLVEIRLYPSRQFKTPDAPYREISEEVLTWMFEAKHDIEGATAEKLFEYPFPRLNFYKTDSDSRLIPANARDKGYFIATDRRWMRRNGPSLKKGERLIAYSPIGETGSAELAAKGATVVKFERGKP